jgi:hypothetical protein
MPGWDSLEAVTRLHGAAQIVGLALLALAIAGAILLFLQLRRDGWPDWIDIGGYQVRSRAFEILGAALLALLLLAEAIAFGYGARQVTLMAAAEQAQADRLKRQAAETVARRTAENSSQQQQQQQQQQRELTSLRQKLIETENRLADLERKQMQKRLTADERRLLIEALRPFAGQKVAIASILGDEDGKTLAEDFVAVFDAAGWDHDGDAGISAQQWPRDPIGIEITLNESDARAGRVTAGIGALINAVRKLGLVYDNTVYMNGDVPAGQALLKVGKKLRK